VSPARKLLIGAQLIDAVGTGSRPATVVVRGDRIEDIVEFDIERNSVDAEIIDLTGKYVLPGLWDSHTHLESRVRPPNPTVPEVTLRHAEEARRGLDAGIVAVRSGGMPYLIDVALRSAISEGLLVGPRIFAAGSFLTTTGGHLSWSPWSRTCDGVAEFSSVVREQIAAGVDHVKVSLSGGIMGPSWDRHTSPYWLDDEMDAVFTIARARGYPVMAHATNPDTVMGAIRRGAHSVEHGYVMDDDCIEAFVNEGTWYVPTLCITHLTRTQAVSHWERDWVEERDLRPDLAARADAAAEQHRDWFLRALNAGVRMAVGSDLGPLESALFQEMELWVKDGATPLQTITAATRNAAELCGVGADTGTIEVGKRADLIAVSANPLTDINNVRGVELVMLGGDVVVDRRNDQGRGSNTTRTG
jgi:imidazolonepropionase-like amidohydrolase